MQRFAKGLSRTIDNLSQMQELEGRRLMSGTVKLPFSLDFGATVTGTAVDKDGQGTGFNAAQTGQASQVDINTAKGTLALTADYSAGRPSASLETAFDGTTRGFTITSRLIGPLSNLLHSGDQAGIFLGPDQNNCVKVTAIYSASGERLQFTAIVNGQSVTSDASTYTTLAAKFNAISTLDVQLTGDAVTGQVSARFAINGKSWTKVAYTLTIPAAARPNFFNSASQTGVLMSDKHGAVTATFDSFSIAAGTTAYVPVATISRSAAIFSDVLGAGSSNAATVRITNTGEGDLTITNAVLAGANVGEFTITNPLSSPITLKTGQRYDFYVTFTATNSGAIRQATLNFTTNDPAGGNSTVALRALGLPGVGGTLEPSLQRIIDMYGIPIDVGESDPSQTAYPVDTAVSPDAVDISELTKSGTGDVSVELLGVFANQNAATLFGWYDAGDPQSTHTVLSIDKSRAQSLSPLDNGITTFDPGSKSFGLWGNFEMGGTNKALWFNRSVYSERSLNTWEPVASRQQKVKFYAYKDSNGTVVPNTYVFAFEEYEKSFDQNDIVGIIRNVQPAIGPEVGLQNMDGVPAADHLVFSRITHPDAMQTNGVHDMATLRVQNTGSQPLTISGMVLSDSNFVIVSGGGAQTLAPGAYTNVVIKFVYDNPTGYNNKIITSKLTINSDDADEPARVVTLSGMWQAYSENNGTDSSVPANYRGNSAEPSAQEILDLYGYKIKDTFRSDLKQSQGTAIAEGEEVLSELWQQADTGLPVTVQQLAAFHGQYRAEYLTKSSFMYFDPSKMDAKGKPLSTKVLTHNQLDGQSILPRIDGSTTAGAKASVFPTVAQFGIRIDANYTIDQYNLPGIKAAPAHAIRIYQAKDANGNIIANTYIVLQDYTESPYVNYDYQDNIYIVSNLKPVSAPQKVNNVKATGLTSGTSVAWTAATAGDVTSYNVWRRVSGTTDAFANIGNTSGTSFADTTATNGTTYDYYVTAVSYQGSESAASTTSSANAGGGTLTIPAAASAVTATANSSTSVAVTWADNSTTEIGFRIERKTGTGGYASVGTVSANVLTFTDATASASTTYTYRVIATNAAGDSAASNESTVSTPATTPTNPTTPAALVSTDIGAPTPAGQVTTVTTGRDYNVTVGGVDIFNTSDSFNYLYGQKTGDFDVAVQVASLTGSDPSAQAGIMVRDGTGAGAKNIEIKAALKGLRLTYRTATSGATTTTGTGDFTGSVYLRLTRIGSLFTAYTSADGQTWTKYGSVTLTLGSTVMLGLATCGHSQSSAATAQYRGYGDTGTVVTPPANTDAAPSGLVASATAPNSVLLNWADNSGGETGFKVERQTAGTWSTVGTVAANVTTFTDNTVNASTTYNYRVSAVGITDTSTSNVQAVTTPGVTSTSQTLTASADTYTYDAKTTTNYGSQTELQVKQGPTGYNRQAFVKFSISSLSSVNTAKIRLFVTLNTADTLQLGVYGVASTSWTETGTTWSNKPASGTQLGTATVSSTTGVWVEIDVSAYVKAAVTAGQTSITLGLQGAAVSTAYASIASRETGANGPQLVVA